jgi:hypothetical protein
VPYKKPALGWLRVIPRVTLRPVGLAKKHDTAQSSRSESFA